MSRPDLSGFEEDKAVRELREQLWILRRDVASAFLRWPNNPQLWALDRLLARESDDPR